MNFEWKLIEKSMDRQKHEFSATYVASIKPGWLVRTIYHQSGIDAENAVNVVFVPDPQHEWEPEFIG